MGILIALFLLAVICLVAFVMVSDKVNGDIAQSLFFIGIASSVVFVMLIALGHPIYNTFKDNYYEAKDQIALIEEADSCGLNIYNTTKVDISTLNSQIKRNKKNCHSFWVNYFSSKKIASYDTLSIKKNIKIYDGE